MGIKGLNKFLRKKCPEIFEEIHISEYAYKKIAIDVSLYLCKYKSISSEYWLSYFIDLVCCLRRNEVHCIFIYDTGSVADKKDEKDKRKELREKNAEKIQLYESALEIYYSTETLEPILKELYDKYIGERKNLLTNKQNINIKLLESIIEKKKSQLLNLTKEDFELTKQLFDLLSIPYFQAPMEAETMCSDLCKRGLVDAVLSEDTDVLAYMCPNFLSKINTKDDTCIYINYDKLLSALEFTKEQFLEFCIMCGTDYNKNIPKIGPDKSFKLLKIYENINEIGNNNIDIKILNHVRVKDIFINYDKFPETKIKYCGKPDINNLIIFATKQNIKLNIDKIKKSFIHNNIVIITDDNE